MNRNRVDLDRLVADEVRAELARRSTLNVTALSSLLCMSRVSLSRRLHGHVRFTPGQLDAIAEVFGIEASEFVARAETRRKAMTSKTPDV